MRRREHGLEPSYAAVGLALGIVPFAPSRGSHFGLLPFSAARSQAKSSTTIRGPAWHASHAHRSQPDRVRKTNPPATPQTSRRATC